MNEARSNFIKGLRIEFKDLRTSRNKDNLDYYKNMILGYINAGYWTNIITEK